jgi:hypothetical protein
MASDRLRVLIVANMYPSPARPSYGVFVADQVAALRATGEVEVEVFHWDARRRPWRYALAALELRLTRVQADVVHAHYGLSGVVALAAPRRIPLVLTVHGRDCHDPVVRRLTSLVARRAAAVVAVSAELAAHCPFAVSAVIPPGADLSLFEPLPRAAARARLGLYPSPEHRLLVFPADPRRPEKRFADARALAERLALTRPDVELRAVFGRPTPCSSPRSVRGTAWPASRRSPATCPCSPHRSGWRPRCWRESRDVCARPSQRRAGRPTSRGCSAAPTPG